MVSTGQLQGNGEWLTGCSSARAVPAEPERGQQSLRLPEQFPGHQGPDADHLESVIGIGDHVGVLTEHVEDGEAVRGEGADSAGRVVPVEVPLSLEPLVAVREPDVHIRTKSSVTGVLGLSGPYGSTATVPAGLPTT
jgi:hypothetical protein